MSEKSFEDKCLEYEELKLEEKALKSRIDELKEDITSQVPEDEKINCRHGVIEMKKRDNWKYSEETTAMASSLKEKQKEEVAKGIAKNSPTYFIEYRQKDKDAV